MNDHGEESNCIVPVLNLDVLKVITPLGRGAKGVVFLVEEEQTGDFCALKVILRDLVEKKHDTNNNNKEIASNESEYRRVCFERQVLSQFKHPLLPKLRGVLATEKIVGYAIDFCSGRDLNQLRKQQSERMFSVDMIRFYAAELVLVLEYLHNLGMAYRDLKPENILIQENGHIMLVDFDLSTKLSQKPHKNALKNSNSVPNKHQPSRKKRISLFHRCCNSGISPDDSSDQGHSTVPVPNGSESTTTEKSNSFVGTEEYVAPEIIQGHGHDSAVDWWSLGVVLYEMLYGVTPFKGCNRKETFYRILTKSPDLVGETTPLRDLIGKLLLKDPRERIRVEEIKDHDFFKGIDWDLILQLERPPYIPPAIHEVWATESKEGNVKIDVESFAERIFVKDEVEKQKIVDDEKKINNNNDSHQQQQETKITDKGVRVKELNNHPNDIDNFIVF